MRSLFRLAVLGTLFGATTAIVAAQGAPTAGENKLLALMPDKPEPDLSRFLLSPMPGLLTHVLVSPGQQVRAGEKLAVIEAMKMQNILAADRDRKVVSLLAQPGDSLQVDQPILELE